MIKNLNHILTRLGITCGLVFLAVHLLYGQECVIRKVEWIGPHSEFDDAQMKYAEGLPCDSWRGVAAPILKYYEDHGFVGVRVEGSVSAADENSAVVENKTAGTLRVSVNRGSAFVWASPENLDSNKTETEVFRKLSGIEEGEPVSLSDLQRSERKLARLGYFEMTAPTRIFRDPDRNRIIPAYSMRDARLSEAEGLLTYSSEDNLWEGQVHVNLYNIGGTARDLQLEGFTGEYSRHLEGRYKEPWLLGTSWNGVIRGSFDEDSAVEDSLEKTAMGEIGLTRDIGFDFSIGVYFGISESDKHSTFELSYVSLDRFALPRSGMSFNTSLSWKMDRPDSLDSYLNASARVVSYFPLVGNFISRFTGAAAGIFPTDVTLKRSDLFSLGGLESFRGMGYRFMRSRAYGFSEMALLWQDGYDLSVELFYQPGLYRRLDPGHGWAREQDYGLGFTQYRKNWSFNLYYALRNGCDYLEGVLGFGVKTLF